MADRPVRNYDGNYITCYPGSNQSDDGKLNMEFNMARFVTRVSSKNFCIVKPSYELKTFRGPNGKPQIQVGTGQCSINGMDLIMTQTLTIDPPEAAGTYYLAFKLARDDAPNPNNLGNVLGDSIYGVTRTFEGVYLTYFDEKPDPLTDPDMLYLGKVTFDGTNITELEEDPDKYGRLWAEDILAKMKDWKHPDKERMILQDWIYKVPDWYVSKEGDVIFGPLEFLAGRDPYIDGTPENHEDLGTGRYGIRAEAIYNDELETRTTKIDIKGPEVLPTDEDKRLSIYASDSGIECDLGRSVLRSNSNNNYALELTTPRNINVTTDNNISLIGKNKVTIGTGSNGSTPKLEMTGNKFTLSSTTASGLKDEVVFASGTVQHIIGGSILQYTANNSKLALLGTATNYFDIVPNVDMTTNARVQGTLYIGNSASYGSDTTKLTKTEWLLTNGSNTSKINGGIIDLYNTTAGSGYINTRQGTNVYSKLINNGNLELSNSGANTNITFKDGNTSYDTKIYKTNGAKTLNLDATLVKVSNNLTATGDIRANRVFNAVYNDIVEFMEKDVYEEDIRPGDVVYFTDSGKVTKWNSYINPNAIAGVVSSEETYGYALGGHGLANFQKVPVGLKGRVYLNVGNLEVKVGDMIAVDINGELYVTEEYGINVLGIATKQDENGRVFLMLK